MDFWDWLTADAVTVFNGLLVIVTVGLLWMGLRQEWWMRKHERAYVIAGPGGRWRQSLSGAVIAGPELGPAIGIAITAGNYGRTPAFLKKITYNLVPMTTGPLPAYPPFKIYEDVLYPQMPIEKVHIIGLPIIPVSGTQSLIFYGRIVYNDIFGREHFSSWKHEIVPDAERNSFGLEGSYSTGWDYNRNQSKFDPP